MLGIIDEINWRITQHSVGLYICIFGVKFGYVVEFGPSCVSQLFTNNGYCTRVIWNHSVFTTFVDYFYSAVPTIIKFLSNY